MGKYKKLSKRRVAAIQMQARYGKRIGVKQLGNVVFTTERNEGRSVKKATKIAGGVIGKIARRKK